MSEVPINRDLQAMRREYLHGGLRRRDLASSPMAQLQVWFQQACDAQLQDPSAMVLATVNLAGMPSQRVVLMKQLDEQGIVFFTNYGSAKADDIAHNDKVSAHFAWLELDRQVRVEGAIEKISAEASATYFCKRPGDSQLAAWASRQSQPVASRSDLDELLKESEAKFSHQDVPAPDFWGGYRIIPQRVEFWQGRAARLHDRLVYTASEDGWQVGRLQP